MKNKNCNIKSKSVISKIFIITMILNTLTLGLTASSTNVNAASIPQQATRQNEMGDKPQIIASAYQLTQLMEVWPEYDYVYSLGWHSNTLIMLTVGGYSTSGYSDGNGVISFDLSGAVDIEPGQTVQLSDGNYTITHVVANVVITDVDQDLDIVYGTAFHGSETIVAVCEHSSCKWISTLAESSGQWAANYSGLVDIALGTEVYAYQSDIGGNSTVVSWDEAQKPYIEVDPFEDMIWAFNFLPGSTLNLTVGAYSTSETADEGGRGVFSIKGHFDLLPGQLVMVSDGVVTKNLTIPDFEIDNIDRVSSTVDGATDPGSQVKISACTYEYEISFDDCAWLYPVADGSGNWSANFGGLIDFTWETTGWAMQSDEDGDRTILFWHVQEPRIHVYLENDIVRGYDWLPNTEISLSIGTYTDSAMSDYEGWVNFDSPTEIDPGSIIEMTDGNSSKSYTVKNIQLTGYDLVYDTLNGIAEPNSGLFVTAQDEFTGPNKVYVVADGDGKWSTNFNDLVDIKVGASGSLFQYEDDGDLTDDAWLINPPTNDGIDDAIEFTVPSVFSQDTQGAERVGTDPSFETCGQDAGLTSVWFKFSPATTRPVMEVSVDTLGSNYDTMLGVWSGSPSNLTLITCNGDAHGTPQSQVTFQFKPGVDYYIGVAEAGRHQNGGLLNLHVTTFADVLSDIWYWKWVEGFIDKGITTGCAASPAKYCPDRAVTRAEMAVFILRAKNGTATPVPATTDQFADVPVTGKEWMKPWIEQFYNEGITTGCAVGPLQYCPERQVTRAEMAVFILRAIHGPDYVPPAATGVFSDVPVAGKAWMQPWIEQFYNEDITTGCASSPLRYCPEQSVTRAEMAVFIDRAFGYPQLP